MECYYRSPTLCHELPAGASIWSIPASLAVFPAPAPRCRLPGTGSPVPAWRVGSPVPAWLAGHFYLFLQYKKSIGQLGGFVRSAAPAAPRVSSLFFKNFFRG